MKYMGSKNRHAKELLPIILKHRKPGQWYVEPFAGGMNMIDKVSGNRVACDIHKQLISCFSSAVSGKLIIPDVITEDIYNEAKKGLLSDDITGFIGFSMSFGGKWFGGYRRDIAGTKGCLENMKTQTRRAKESLLKQIENLKDVVFLNKSYHEIQLTKQCIIYCDPPYRGTTKYIGGFDHDHFWEWCRAMAAYGHYIYISEYSAPDDFICIYSKKTTAAMSLQNNIDKNRVEKLFIHKSQTQ